MSNALFTLPKPKNEPVYDYAPGSPERELLRKEIERQKKEKIEIPVIIGGKEIKTGDTAEAVCPHDHNHVLATYHKAGEKEIKMAVDAALEAKENWEKMPWNARAAIFLKAGHLLSTKYRYILNAATMLNQSKSVNQAEIDSCCELVDFFRFNAYYMQEIYKEQPMHNPEGMWNRLEYRPLEGFVFAVTPFNFTSIAGNLPSSPALMGNTVVWKPASTSVYSGYVLMQLFKEAGFPDGVINFIPGRGSEVGKHVLPHKDLAGIHFTGSTGVFQRMWKVVGENIENYKTYPRIVGETGGKDFIMVHNTADARQVAVAAVRAAYEYQGQKCSAASRMYVPSSKWDEILGHMKDMVREIKMDDVENFGAFMNSVIDENSFNDITAYIERAEESDKAEIVYGGGSDKSKGYFIEPTLIKTTDPHYETMEEELFGPVLTVYVYEDEKFEETIDILDKTSPYALTGALFCSDRNIIESASWKLRNAAGNYYINDKPTAAVVGQQPFGGARGSGTNDKAGSHVNLLRWTSQRTIKETFNPPTDHTYPFMK
ncbi:MAG: L-glutamate gamma-semialdehyde dehydrogenase [bacterium]